MSIYHTKSTLVKTLTTPLHSHFMFHAALIPILSLRADPTAPRSAMWSQDITTVRWLCETTFVNHALGKRALNAINQLLPDHTATGGATNMHFDFADPTFQSWFPWPVGVDQSATATATGSGTMSQEMTPTSHGTA